MRIVQYIMSTLLYTILGLTVGSTLHCAVRKEISPCTCRLQDFNRVQVSCERMTSFSQVVDALQDRFSPSNLITLKITFSSLDDLPRRNFQELNMTVVNLQLLHDNLSELSPSTFTGLEHTLYLSLADNALAAIPQHVLAKMPYVKTLDIGRGRITSLRATDFKNLPYLQHIILAGNRISVLEEGCLPIISKQIHIGRNQIKTLNGTLRDMSELEWLFINANRLTSLDGQLPQNGNKLTLIHGSINMLEKLPQDLKNLQKIESLFFQQNLITSLDGAVSKSRRLKRLQLSHNRIHMLAEDDFLETESLQDLQLGHNLIPAINNSLLPLRNLRVVNLTHNCLTEFSLHEIRGLQWLRIVDVSHNKISKLGGRMENLVEWKTHVMELRLEHNELKSLDGSLNGLHGLLRLNLSHNRLTSIAPDDLIGLEELRMLDISHNQLTTLEETSKTYLPFLEELIASHNYLTLLEKDFHGLPVLCWADLSYNQIRYLGRDLVSKTRCMVHGIPGTLKLYLQDNPILCDDELPEIISAMEINHTRIHGTAKCDIETSLEDDNLNINSPFASPLLDIFTPSPQIPIINNQRQISANQIPLSVTREPPVEIQVIPLQPAAAIHESPIEKSSDNLIIEKPVDIEKTP